MNVLIAFKCNKPCDYEEVIGVDVRCGLIISGDITVVCPKCGGITVVRSALVMTPVKFCSYLNKKGADGDRP